MVRDSTGPNPLTPDIMQVECWRSLNPILQFQVFCPLHPYTDVTSSILFLLPTKCLASQLVPSNLCCAPAFYPHPDTQHNNKHHIPSPNTSSPYPYLSPKPGCRILLRPTGPAQACYLHPLIYKQVIEHNLHLVAILVAIMFLYSLVQMKT